MENNLLIKPTAPNIFLTNINSISRNKTKWENICKKYNIYNSAITTILLCNGNDSFVLKKFLIFKHYEKLRQETELKYNSLHNSIWNKRQVPTYEEIENCKKNSKSLSDYYEREFNSYNVYLNSLYPSKTCYICHDSIDYCSDLPIHNFVVLICNHPFHISCIGVWLKKKNNCPTCRKQLQLYNDNNISDTDTDTDYEHNFESDEND